jgi:hypothetical protein
MTPGTDRFGQLRFSASTTIKLGCKACSVAGAFDPALLERAYYLRGWALIENLFRCAQCHQDRSGGSHSTTNLSFQTA